MTINFSEAQRRAIMEQAKMRKAIDDAIAADPDATIYIPIHDEITAELSPETVKEIESIMTQFTCASIRTDGVALPKTWRK